MVCRLTTNRKKQSMWPPPYIAGSQMGQEEYSITKPFSEDQSQEEYLIPFRWTQLTSYKNTQKNSRRKFLCK